MLNSVSLALSQWPASVWQWKACLRSCHRSPGVRLMSCPACMESLREQRFYHAGGWHLSLHPSTLHPHEDDTLCVFLWWRWMLKSQLILFSLAHSGVLNSVLFHSRALPCSEDIVTHQGNDSPLKCLFQQNISFKTATYQGQTVGDVVLLYKDDSMIGCDPGPRVEFPWRDTLKLIIHVGLCVLALWCCLCNTN